MDLIYVGPYGPVTVPLPNGEEIAAVPGEPVTFPADVAEALLAQPDNWQPAPTPAPEPAPRKSR